MPAGSFPLPQPSSFQPSAEMGRRIYQVKCALCHGEAGRGDGPVGKKLLVHVTDLTAPPVQTQSDDQLLQTIAHGKRVMRSFSSELSEGEIRALVLFLRTMK